MGVRYIQPLHMVFRFSYNHHMWGIKQSDMYFITIPSELIAPKLHANCTRYEARKGDPLYIRLAR
jgi:hypothetical protein